jgi:purine-binding chemotaxis protein CheW
MSSMHVRVLAGGEHYAIPVAGVLEIAEHGEVSEVPGSPPEVLGVRNLRGQVIAVIDLAAGLDLQSSSDRERIVVVEDSGRLAGFAVDAVVDVGVLGEATEEVDSPYLRGALLVDGALVGVVDIAALFARVAPSGDPLPSSVEAS